MEIALTKWAELSLNGNLQHLFPGGLLWEESINASVVHKKGLKCVKLHAIVDLMSPDAFAQPPGTLLPLKWLPWKFGVILQLFPGPLLLFPAQQIPLTYINSSTLSPPPPQPPRRNHGFFQLHLAQTRGGGHEEGRGEQDRKCHQGFVAHGAGECL